MSQFDDDEKLTLRALLIDLLDLLDAINAGIFLHPEELLYV